VYLWVEDEVHDITRPRPGDEGWVIGKFATRANSDIPGILRENGGESHRCEKRGAKHVENTLKPGRKEAVVSREREGNRGRCEAEVRNDNRLYTTRWPPLATGPPRSAL
jgi:hypothetical protein